MKNKGITLIALIITIIVMLILVAVTINMAVNGGLFGYAGNAARDTETEKQKEINWTNPEANMTTDQLIEKYTTDKEADLNELKQYLVGENMFIISSNLEEIEENIVDLNVHDVEYIGDGDDYNEIAYSYIQYKNVMLIVVSSNLTGEILDVREPTENEILLFNVVTNYTDMNEYEEDGHYYLELTYEGNEYIKYEGVHQIELITSN